MRNKLKAILIMTLTLLLLSLCFVSAADTDSININEYISYDENGSPSSTDSFLVTVEKPEASSVYVFKKTYVISGFLTHSGMKDVRVALYKYNDQTKKYEAFTTIEGDSKWDVGSFGMFTREIALNDGVNKLLIAAYKKTDANNLKLGKTLQTSFFTIEVKKESVLDKILKYPKKVIDIFEGILNDK